MLLDEPRIDRLLIVEGDDYGRDTLGQSLIGCTMSSTIVKFLKVDYLISYLRIVTLNST
jgi:hypothetical protein